MCRKDEDRLSSLPKDVLVLILSCLSTKYAISTSVLSWSWRYLWTQLTVLRFTTSDDLIYLEHVLKSCPSLEILRVEVDAYTELLLAHPIEIKSRNLKWLRLNLVGTYQAFGVGKKLKEVIIDAPKLEYLEVNSPIMFRFCFLKPMCGLSRAKLSMGSYQPSRYRSICNVNPKQILMLLNPVVRVKTLSLCGENILNGLFFTDENKLEIFHTLTRVEMKISSRELDWLSLRGVCKFLKACPNLKSLVLRRKYGKLSWVKKLFSFMSETNLPSTSSCVGDFSLVDDMKLIGDFDRVKKDGKIMVEITVHVYQNDDQLIYYVKGLVLPNQLWDD